MRLDRALVAQSVQHDFVRLQLEAVGGQVLEIAGAAVNLEHAGALPAAEVMVVCRPRALVAGGFARQFNGHEPATLYERIDCSVHGGNTEFGHMVAPILEHLGGAERARRLLEYLPDGISLPRVAFHAVQYDMVIRRVASVA